MTKESLEVGKEPNHFQINMSWPMKNSPGNFWTGDLKRIRSLIKSFFPSENETFPNAAFNLNQVRIEKQGKWHVVSGTVDSHRTKVRYLSSVPTGNDGVRWIVDRLKIEP